MNMAHGLEAWYAPWLFWGTLGAGLFVGLLLVASLAVKPNNAGAPPPPRRPDTTK
jgi:hypothetical protein